MSSASKQRYGVRIRSLTESLNGCDCPDFKTNTLGTCKHIEGVLQHLRKRHTHGWKSYIAESPQVIMVFLDRSETTQVRVSRRPDQADELGPFVSRSFDAEGVLQGRVSKSLRAMLREHQTLPHELAERLVINPEIIEYLNEQIDIDSVAEQKSWFLDQVTRGHRSFGVTGAVFYPFQEKGVLHLTFGRRVVLADDMGLGKTVQAIAAAALLKQLRGIEHVLVVTAASLKHQWHREITRFTSLSAQVVEGNSIARRGFYHDPVFFNIVNYELLMHDEALLAERVWDLVILDEAQRIENWRTKTAAAVKRLRSQYAFVLTGTPFENRLDDLYSIFQFVGPHVLGPPWRYNERCFQVERRPSGSYKVLGHRNLHELRRRISPYLLRRRREEVLLDLPNRSDNNFFVEMTDRQMTAYAEYEGKVARLMTQAKRRPLSPEEMKILQGWLVKMRLICNALALRELREIRDEEVVSNGHKAVVFSQWTTMLEFCEPLLKRQRIEYVKLTGSVPTAKRTVFDATLKPQSEVETLSREDLGQSILRRLEVMLEERPVNAQPELAPTDVEAAPVQEPAVSIQTLADAFAAARPGRILLVRGLMSGDTGCKPKVLVVVDRKPAELRLELSAVVEKELVQLGMPELLFLEQENYRAPASLVGEKLAESGGQDVYRASGWPPQPSDPRKSKPGAARRRKQGSNRRRGGWSLPGWC